MSQPPTLGCGERILLGLWYPQDSRLLAVEHRVNGPCRRKGLDAPRDASLLRLWFSSVAYVLMNELRRLGLQGTAMENAQCQTIRLKRPLPKLLDAGRDPDGLVSRLSRPGPIRPIRLRTL